MKRREFVAATLLSLLAGQTSAAPRKTPPAKKPARPAARKTISSATAPVIDRPPDGSSASRLPPVKALEPPTNWQDFEITTSFRFHPSTPDPIRLWLPLPLNQDSLYQRTTSHRWRGNADLAGMRRLPDGDLELFFCEWQGGSEARLELTTTLSTADRVFDIARRSVAPEREDILRRNLQASSLIPNDGPAHALGERIIGRIKDPVAQAKAIYDWVADNATYRPELPAGSAGDVRQQFAQGQFGGRSAEINGLFVALCRAIGIPARCVQGLRVGDSRLFGCLGITNQDATRQQHCRAEFYVPGYGWIPVDPSDVGRAKTLEGLSDHDGRLGSLKRVLFGVWEMNWVAYNVGTDLELPGSSRRIPVFMRAHLETGDPGEATPADIAIRVRRITL